MLFKSLRNSPHPRKALAGIRHSLVSSLCRKMGNSLSEREKNEADFGEELYEIVQQIYPEHADYITGMLLELDCNELKRILTSTNREELLCKIHKAAGHVLPERLDCQLVKDSTIEQSTNPENPCLSFRGNSHVRDSSTDISDKSNKLERCSILPSGSSIHHNDSLKTKQALGEQMYALIEEQYPEDAEKLTGILLEMDIQSLELMIKDSNLLEQKLGEIISLLENDSGQIKNSQTETAQRQCQDKTSIGEELYSLVSELGCDQADKITGMLLEMDAYNLEVILRDQEVLKEKVNQALWALNNQSDVSETISPSTGQEDKAVYGEQLYYKICEWFPENADKISGMLLEMNIATLEMLLNDSAALQEKAAYAASILSSTKTNSETQHSLPPSEKSEAETIKRLEEKLYDIINDWYPGKAHKLTGMLMDIDSAALENLVLNKQMLKEKVEGALAVLHRMEQTSSNREPTKHCSPRDSMKDELGEQLYVKIEESHSENADKITGMLLEMSVEDLHRLLKNPLELQEKIMLAENVLKID